MKELVGRYRRVFAGKDGEAVLKDLEARCFINETTFSENHGRMAFNEGRRSILVRIQSMISVDPSELADLPREYKTKPKE